MTILVVDDERNIADSIAGTLIAELNTDAEVHVCYGSQQAKDFFRNALYRCNRVRYRYAEMQRDIAM